MRNYSRKSSPNQDEAGTPPEESSEPELKWNLKDEDRILDLYSECFAAECDPMETYALCSMKCPELTNELLNGIVARKVEREPEWKINAEARKFSGTAAAKVAMLRKLVRMDDPFYARGHAQLRIREYAPKTEDITPRRINSPITLLLMPEIAEKVKALDEAVKKRIIDAEYEPKRAIREIEGGIEAR